MARAVLLAAVAAALALIPVGWGLTLLDAADRTAGATLDAIAAGALLVAALPALALVRPLHLRTGRGASAAVAAAAMVLLGVLALVRVYALLPIALGAVVVAAVALLTALGGPRPRRPPARHPAPR